MKVLAIGGDFFTDFFRLIGFERYSYRGNCSEVLEFLGANLNSIELVVISSSIDVECAKKIEKVLEANGVNYLIISEPSEADKENVDEYYDKIIKALIS